MKLNDVSNHTTLLFNIKDIIHLLVKKNTDTIPPIARGGDMGILTFPPRALVWKWTSIARLEFELAYFETTEQPFNHYFMGHLHPVCIQNISHNSDKK